MAADVAQASEQAVALSVLMIDLDHFKAVNDTYGHQTGITFSRTSPAALTENVRSTDVVARWGGEEFAILMRHCDLDEAINTAEHLRARISDGPLDAVRVVTASIGVAEHRPGEDITSLLARADKALYEAKGPAATGCAAAPPNRFGAAAGEAIAAGSSSTHPRSVSGAGSSTPPRSVMEPGHPTVVVDEGAR